MADGDLPPGFGLHPVSPASSQHLPPGTPDHIIEAMLLELILAGNGPGELSGWVSPVARATRWEIPDLRFDPRALPVAVRRGA